ncbi:hypothetical protein MCERE10_03280 [Burkholderiaceae bacterium]|jgi:hypothetical protein
MQLVNQDAQLELIGTTGFRVDRANSLCIVLENDQKDDRDCWCQPRRLKLRGSA